MKITLGIAVSFLAAGALAAGVPTSARAGTQNQDQATGAGAAQKAQGAQSTDGSKKADAYYYFVMGHENEMEYESTGRGELATQAIDSYKKALEIDPDSVVIMERLAEVYAKSQHIRDAVVEAQAVLKIDPDNVAAHRLLARIYVRTLGDMNAGAVQQDNLTKAIEQFEAVLKGDPGDLSSALWLARLYRFENQHAEAEQVLRDALRHDPENGPALEQLSQLLMDEGRTQEAITLLSQAAADSASPDVLDLLGDSYSQSKDYAKSEEAYRKAVDMDPDDPQHRHGLAQALLNEDKYADALEQFKKLAEIEPGTAENYLRMSQLYRRLGQFDQAEASLMRAKQLAPGSLEVLYNEALLYQDEGRTDDAIKILNEAINGLRGQSSSEGNPNALAILYEQLGIAYREQQNYPAAIRTFEDMGKLNAESKRRAQMLLIDTYRESRDLDRAITETQKALEASPKDQDLTVTLATLYGEKGETDEATKLLKAMLHGDEGDQEIYLDLAQVQERGKHYDDAEASAQKAEQLARESADKQSVWFMLGAIYERQKKFGPAEDEFRKVLQVNPTNADVLNYYGYMLADRGVRLEEAQSLIQRALSNKPNSGAYLDSLGWVYFKQNKLAEAEEYLRKAADRSRHDPTILGHLGEVYAKLGQSDRAAELMERSLTEWQRALPGDYDPDMVTELEAQLKTLKHRLAQKSSPENGKPQ